MSFPPVKRRLVRPVYVISDAGELPAREAAPVPEGSYFPLLRISPSILPHS